MSAPVARAQSGKAPRRIGFLSPGTRELSQPNLDVFRTALKGLGYAEGRDLAFDIRWSDGITERLPALARELLALNPAVIVTATQVGVETLKAATSTVPVVFIAVSNPDKQGYVASLARPGGNMTGTASRVVGFSAKLAEVLREILPAAKRVALLDLEDYPSRERNRAFFEKMLASRGFELAAVVPVGSAEDLPRAYVQIKAHKAEIVWAVPHALLVAHARKLSELAQQARLPLVGARRAFAEGGGLLSYDNDVREDYRRAAFFVDRILKGAKPAELPVEQLDRFQLVLNLRTANALNIRIPQAVRARADEVIE
jgi:putative ABC transport system substrate-binding protein